MIRTTGGGLGSRLRSASSTSKSPERSSITRTRGACWSKWKKKSGGSALAAGSFAARGRKPADERGGEQREPKPQQRPAMRGVTIERGEQRHDPAAKQHR